jgi:hypothetical protein
MQRQFTAATESELSPRIQLSDSICMRGRWNKSAVALREARRKAHRRAYSLILRLRILRLDLRSFARHICIVFSKGLYAERSNLVLGLLSVSNERHLCQTQKADHNCGICNLFACCPEASFHDARLFLAGWLAASGYDLAGVQDIRDFYRRPLVHHECAR